MHDAVNAHLGKPVKFPQDLCIAAAQLGNVAHRYDRCHLEEFIFHGPKLPEIPAPELPGGFE